MSPLGKFGRTVLRDGQVTRTAYVITCSKCGVVATGSADFKGRPDDDRIAGILERKFRGAGWDVADKADRHLCPGCRSKVISMSQIAQKLDVRKSAEEPRKPSREEKRRILDLLDEHYCVKSGRYLEAYSDERIASEAKVPRKWVADLRVEFFGDSGASEASVEVLSEVAKIRADLDELMKMAEEYRSRVDQMERKLGA